jgi:hypothetical protein
MRIMETGVKEFATFVGANIKPKDTWGGILNSIDGAVKAMPSNTAAESETKETCQQMSVSLRAVKDAFRDPTMHHIRRIYTEEGAQDVFGCARVFMRRLADTIP